MEVVKGKNKQKVDQIDNEVMMLSHVANAATKNKNQNDEIINNNVSNEQHQQQQQQKKGKNNKKKKNKQKNSHNNDKVGDDEMSKKQIIITKQDQLKLQEKHEEEELKTQTATERDCNDKNHNNGNNLLSVSQAKVEDEVLSVEGTNSTLNKPFIAPLAVMSTETTTIENKNNNNDVDTDTLYCPLTPRRIVDVQEEEEEAQAQPYYDLKKSNTINSINHKSVDKSLDELETYNTSQVNNEYYDDEDYDDGDNGLLVQFLDEANKIVSFIVQIWLKINDI